MDLAALAPTHATEWGAIGMTAPPSTPTDSQLVKIAEVPQLPVWRYVGRLAPLALLWIVMAGLLGWLLYSRAGWNEKSDQADMREWIDNTRIFRKTPAELVKEYVDLLSEPNLGLDYSKRVKSKRDEIDEQDSRHDRADSRLRGTASALPGGLQPGGDIPRSNRARWT